MSIRSFGVSILKHSAHIAETWPWDEDYRETLWERTLPYLYAKLPDQAEAAEWKARLDAEAARKQIDAAICKALGVPTLAVIRELLVREPGLTGHAYVPTA